MSKARVLIADDDKAIRTVLSQALNRAGYEVRATGTASTLWEWVSSGDGDVVITDVIMPDQNAFDLIPRIKRLRPDLPIIVISAQNTLTTAITAAETGHLVFATSTAEDANARAAALAKRVRERYPQMVTFVSAAQVPDEMMPMMASTLSF